MKSSSSAVLAAGCAARTFYELTGGAVFDWDQANIGHIAEHGVEAIEAEEAVTYRPVFVQYLSRGREDRFMQIGETLAGRVLVVVITPRNGLTRVVTCYPASRAYREFYAIERDAQYGGGEENPS